MGSHQQRQMENPDETLETSSSLPLPTPSKAAGDSVGRGEDPRDLKPLNIEISDLEKKQRRAERFGIQVQLSEEEKRSSRAERFGGVSATSGKNGAHKLEEDKRKARAERFGLTGETTIDEQAKKKARLERFASKPNLITPEEEKRKARRVLRFSGTSSAASQVSGKVNTELNSVIGDKKGAAAETKGGAKSM